MRRAIFGGTFDPVHRAHLAVANEAFARFQLDEVLFIPAAVPPHKRATAPFEHRFRMCELACEADARFRVLDIEAKRARSYSMSYSILTIEELQAGHPGDRFFFLIGADAFAEIRTWRRWEDVIAKVEFIVVTRPGHTYDAPAGARIHTLDTLSLSVSSSRIRADLAAGQRPAEVPAAVLDYIRAHGLYA